MCSPSATLTVWARSWLAGASAPDDVLAALHAWAPANLVAAGDQVTAGRTGLPWPDPEDTGVTALLKTVREAAGTPGSGLRLVLPVPGDVRGLPIGSAFAAAAVTAGEGVLIGVPGTDGTGLVPRSDGPETLVWTAYSVPLPFATSTDMSIGEADHAMREAVREAADALVRIQRVAAGSAATDPRAAVEDRLAHYAQFDYPGSLSTRARRVLDAADRVEAILTVAQHKSASTPASATGFAAHDELLRPLRDAVRAARLAACEMR